MRGKKNLFELKAFAKINLGLEIVGKRSDGYHLLRTVFQTISLHDTMAVAANDRREMHLSGDDSSVAWDESNTVFRAWDLLRRKCGISQGFDVAVTKRIPPGSGLGGGSANAGVFLLFVNRFLSLDLTAETMIGLAAEIGADVPFFIVGGTALGEGAGEKLTPLPDLPEREFILVLPEIHVSTHLVFSRFVLTKGAFAGKIEIFLKDRDCSVLENQLEKATIELFPKIGEFKHMMLAAGCTFVQMSGSGSALIADAAPAAFSSLQRQLPGQVILCRTIGQKHYQENVLGCSQAVRHRSLEPRIGGSNPPTPEKKT